MLCYPHAKINLGLHILRRRPDGFHDLDTVFYPLHGCTDALEMLASPDGRDRLFFHDESWTEAPESNLVWKAMVRFRRDFPGLEPLHWHLKKGIPSGAGLGGGSSDAAFALRLMAGHLSIPLSDPRLSEMAASLGSDCAYFLMDGPAAGTGRGEVLRPVKADLSAFRIEWVYPGVHISTAQAFSGVRPREGRTSVAEIVAGPVHTWRELLVNDFEETVFGVWPGLAELKEDFYRRGAVYASLSGSGSAVYGLFSA
jgi:4-diphosphocytidyl-2-C-methyl-D-erythritol kinase